MPDLTCYVNPQGGSSIQHVTSATLSRKTDNSICYINPQDARSISGRQLQSVLFVLSLTEFDVILGMDWLSRYGACIDCCRKRVTLRFGEEVFSFQGTRSVLTSLISALQVDRLRRKDRELFLAYVRDVSVASAEIGDVPVVREFRDVFPDELVSLPPEREVEFCIEVILKHKSLRDMYLLLLDLIKENNMNSLLDTMKNKEDNIKR